LYGPRFELRRFPEEIQSGYFSLRYGLKGCPKVGGRFQAPQPFRFCHESMAKDHADHGHGAERVEGTDFSYYDQAVRLAVQATRKLWEQFRGQVLEEARNPEVVRWLAYGNPV
jgi:hypothetical protein